MSLRDRIAKVEAAVKAAEAKGQDTTEAAYQATRDLPIADMKAVYAHIVDARSNGRRG